MLVDYHADLQLVGRPNYFFYLAPSGSDDLDVPAGWSRTNSLTNANAVFLMSPVTEARLGDMLKYKSHLTPVIPLFGYGEPWMDHIRNPKDPKEACELASQILARICDLPPSVQNSTNMDDMLLARLYSRQVELHAVYTPHQKQVVSYPAAGRISGLIFAANSLSDRGLLQKIFFDRLHVCPHCTGERFNIREECVCCRSANVFEATIVHHYRCGHEAIESAFRTPTRFQCPKCGDSLRHIGQDYDKPGQAIICRGCGSRNDACAVGFRCLDCDTHYDSDKVPTRDYYHYELSALGTEQILLGPIAAQLVQAPEQLRVLLRQMLNEQEEFKTAFSVAEISFAKPAALYTENPNNWSRTLNLVRDCISSAVRPVDSVFEYNDEFIVLLPRTTPRQATKALQDVGVRMGEVLKYDPGLQTRLLDDVEQLLLLNTGARQ